MIWVGQSHYCPSSSESLHEESKPLHPSHPNTRPVRTFYLTSSYLLPRAPLYYQPATLASRLLTSDPMRRRCADTPPPRHLLANLISGKIIEPTWRLGSPEIGCGRGGRRLAYRSFPWSDAARARLTLTPNTDHLSPVLVVALVGRHFVNGRDLVSSWPPLSWSYDQVMYQRLLVAQPTWPGLGHCTVVNGTHG